MKEPSTSASTSSAKKNDDSDEDEDINIITDGLLTSLTDTAISNLSQLAALQERCESQQQHSHQSQYQQQQPTTKQQQQQPTKCDNLSEDDDPLTMTVGGGVILDTSEDSGGGGGTMRDDLDDSNLIDEFILPIQDSFLASAAATSQASATAALCGSGQVMVSSAVMQPTQTSTTSSSMAMMGSHGHQRHISASSSISPPSTIHQADLASSGGSGQSLASTVAAAALAAAAANLQDHQNQPQQHYHHHQQQHHLTHQRYHHQQQQHQQQQQMMDPLIAATTSRHRHLIGQSPTTTSALTSPDFYHNFQHAQNLQHQQQHHQQSQHQRPSSSASLHFSPSTSITPSPISPLMQQQSRRSMTFNTTSSSSLMSPIASPNYLRRQFMTDRIPLMSPSPTSGIITGSSGASSSLSHILHNQHHHHSHHQQRSISALGGGPILSPSPTAWSPLSGSTSSTAVSPLMNNKNSSQARLNNMQIRHKFGYLGSGRAQFNSPHGFCLGLNQEIVVADTNNHRVCIFDKSGTYITQFGSPGKEEGQLWNPRKVAILHRPIVESGDSASGLLSSSLLGHPSIHHQHQQQLQHNQHMASRHHHQISKSTYSSGVEGGSGQFSGSLNQYLIKNEPLYVVCDRGAERSRMQLFTKDGSFIKKIGIHYIDIVAGLAITQNGLIIVVDSVSPTVYIINGETGVLNGWFDCSGHMKEPSDIAVKSDSPGNEYFICDFKGHCVVVFSEQGEYLRRIGHDGLTSYPNGIDISDDGDILVGDSHGNRFHVVVFDRNGNFVSQFECPHVKVSRCCGLKITREGYIVTLAKNNHHVLVLDTIHI